MAATWNGPTCIALVNTIVDGVVRQEHIWLMGKKWRKDPPPIHETGSRCALTLYSVWISVSFY
jgi:hypothetical protein